MKKIEKRYDKLRLPNFKLQNVLRCVRKSETIETPEVKREANRMQLSLNSEIPSPVIRCSM